MKNGLRAAGLAAGLAAVAAFAPLAASAATLDPANTLEDGGSYDIFDGPYFFDVTFEDPDGAESYSFTFENLTTTSQALAASFGTFVQSTLSFVGGVTISWASGESAFINGETVLKDTFELMTTIAPGGSDTLTLSFGDPEGGPKDRGNVDLVVNATPAPVPVPAGGLLLVSALGGLALMRRRSAQGVA